MRLVTLALLALIALIQAELWFGKGSVPRVMELHAKLDEQRAENDVARLRNDQTTAEVRDLREGLEMVEERARYELGMVRPDEILVQVTPPRSTSVDRSSAAGLPASPTARPSRPPPSSRTP